ncbi:hypothetical protein KIN20_011973 [Parelaphostrongylus tenuis]|uniref:Uncharacterized protein n=1 Tax=Parelaphostrongylus tenuis TaxID=148309 RepID=A0AAD5MA74_PARTN|nr:hypothetical protein KIN20_011973 [Parelaphostrongylus tenuis]
MLKMAREARVSERGVVNIVKNKLKLRSYYIARVHFPNEQMKEKRLSEAQPNDSPDSGCSFIEGALMYEKIICG